MRVGIVCFFLLTAWGASGQVIINEVCAANADVILDPEYGNFVGWVELYNPSNNPANISWFMLSDDPAIPNKWLLPENSIIPAKGYLLIWCDERWLGNHAGFSLDADGESVVLHNNNGQFIDRIDFPSHPANTSYARVSDGSALWRKSAKPTPRAANTATTAGEQLSPPVFSKTPGRYAGNVSISLSHPQNGVTIRYTTNGAEPTEESTRYTNTITLSATKIVKARAFHNDFLPSNAAVATYLVNEHASTLPVVSISTTPDYLWDNTIGIYTDGTNGIPGNCNGNNMNWNQDWSRHATFEYFDEQGKRAVDQHVDIRIGGACSRNFPQKSFVIQPKKKYGDNDIDYAFFPSKKNVDEFGELFLRNAGNDFNNLMFRDAFFQQLASSKMDVDFMAYQPTVFYLNGEYWGIQNLREKIDGDFIESNYNIDKDDVDLLETWENAIEGDNSAWVNYRTTLAGLNPNDPATFDFIDANIDVQEYINYLVTEIFVGNTDWPGNNVKFWRERSANGKFRWILWDTDFGFGLYGTPPDHPTLNFATETNGPGWPNPPWSTLHIRLVLQNPEFRNRFIATLATAVGTTFKPDNVNALLDQFADRIADEVPYHKQRWGGNEGDWLFQLQFMKDFGQARYNYMKGHVGSFFGLGAPLSFSVQAQPADAARFLVNGVTTSSFTGQPYYTTVPFAVEPKPNAGFRFTGWTITKTNNEFISLVNNGDAWRYFDQGTLPGASWSSKSFNDAAWAQGNAQLGYGDGDEATVVSFGSDANNKFVTTYFRKSFTVSDLANLTDITASVLFDDGVVVYLNGLEVYRNNLPAGAISNSTLALSAYPENSPATFTIDKNLLTLGTNVLAVEVHQTNGTSSDISFDFQASMNRLGGETTTTTNEPLVEGVAFSDVTMVATFTPVASIEGLVLNEVSPAQSFARDNASEAEDWIELYNAGTQPIDLNGLMLTDNQADKARHTINAGEIPWLLQPGAYQLLWADGQPEQGKDHLNFKLSADGEFIGIYHAAGYDTAVIAEESFGVTPTGYSLARLPNAVGPLQLTNVLTPGQANEVGAGEWFYPNPVSETLNVLSPNEGSILSITNAMGQLVEQFALGSGIQTINIRGLNPGLYFIKLTSDQTNQISRLVVR